tara:strand:- start:21610 stop:23286 length:1677 start_codon:yes stop_codon:yes gene_type:complete
MIKNWIIKDADKDIINELSQTLNVSEIVAHLLTLRGIQNFEQAKKFFRPKLSDLHDPFLMKNMHSAVKRIEHAIVNKEKILVYGDYDVDGTTAVSLMFNFLKKQTTEIDYYVPCRYEEGYGISLKGIDYAYNNNFSLIIALDCGIRANKQIEYANTKQIDFIICDHHTPSNKIPSAYSILNPKQKDCQYPYKHLSGCGVGFKLIQAFCIYKNLSLDEAYAFLDLVTVSIGADIVPIDGENRVLAFYGMQKINSNPSIGVKTLTKFLKSKDIKMSDVIFGIAPRINAAGRIDHAKKAVDLLVEKDFTRANLILNEIEKNNDTRKEIEKKITEDAVSKVDNLKKSIVVYSNKWHKGVVGIVASRIVEKFYKPTIVLVEQDGMLVGSARSVNKFDVYEAINKCSHLLEKFGGHKYAAGLSIKKEKINLFINTFEDAVNQMIKPEHLHPNLYIDMQIKTTDINHKLYRIIQQFAPFGPTNMNPVFVSKKVIDSGHAKQVGEDKAHLKLNILDDHKSISAIAFGLGTKYDITINKNEIDICYSISENEWNGNKQLQLLIKDIK